MYLIPLVRLNRAITSCYILPLDPFQCIAISEFISVFLPLLNDKIFAKMFGYTKSIAYSPIFILDFLKTYENSEKFYYKNEVSFLIFINLFLIYKYLNF